MAKVRSREEILEAMHVLKDNCQGYLGDKGNCDKDCPLYADEYTDCLLNQTAPCDFDLKDKVEDNAWKCYRGDGVE